MYCPQCEEFITAKPYPVVADNGDTHLVVKCQGCNEFSFADSSGEEDRAILCDNCRQPVIWSYNLQRFICLDCDNNGKSGD